MKVQAYEKAETQRVLAAMIMDRTVCARIAGKWEDGGMFSAKEDNLIGGWCVRHFRKYGEQPGKLIRSMFDSWAASRGDHDEGASQLVGRRLAEVSDRYEREGPIGSVQYVLDMAGGLFNYSRLKRLKEDLEQDVDLKDPDAAEKRIVEWRRVELGMGAIIDPAEDADFWADVFDESQSAPLLTYPGRLGEFFGDDFARECFVAFIASSKRGKSWWLLDLAYRATRQGCRVLYFEAGDLSRKQVGRRMVQRALRRPKVDKECWVPVDYPDLKEPPATEKRLLRGISEGEAMRAWHRLTKSRGRFRLSCHSNNSLTVSAVSSAVQGLSDEGWVPDVVVIDYADILAPPAGIKEGRDQINENWKHLRRISQEYHCLVVTATQGDAKSYDAKLLRRSNFSDDRRKHDHVTAMYALNVTDEDKQVGVTRVNCLDRRESEFTEGRQVWVAGCLAIGCPAMKSTS